MTTQPSVVSAGKDQQFASLYVGDLVNDVTEAVLYEIFNGIGPVASIRVCRDSVTRRSLGYAYVNFHNAADAERAMEALNYTDIKGNPCRIMWCHRDPTARRSAAGNIYIKNLDKSIDNRALYDTFSVFGNILSCKISNDAEGKSRGFAFVHFETEESAIAAIDKCNGMQLGEKTVFVGPFTKASERPSTDKPFTNIYVKHLPETWDEPKLQAEFAAFGEVTSVMVKIDAKNRRFGFVNFKEFDTAKSAVDALHGKDLRTPEEVAAADSLTEEEKAEIEAETDDGIAPFQLYVVRAQSKTERQQELKSKFAASPSAAAAAKAAAPAAPVQNSNLYIKNLSESVDDAELHRMFETFGAITSAKIMRDDKGASRCFGFVCFSNAEEATRAVTEMHLKLVNGKPLYVGLHERRDQRMERLQQRYRLNAMAAPAGMALAGPGLHPAMHPAMAGLHQARALGPAGLYGAGVPTPNLYYNPMQAGPRGPMGAPQPGARMGAPQLGGQPGFPGAQQPRLVQQPIGGPSAGQQLINPQAAAAMRAAAAGMAPQGARPGMPQMPQQARAPGAPGMMTQQMRQPLGAARPGFPQTVGGRPGWNEPAPQAFDPSAPLTAAALAAAPPQMQKQMLGEKLFPQIVKYQPELAGKITGMMLEMDNSELLILLESEQQLRAKVEEAIRVLHGQ